MPAQLLVSVRSAEEAAAALAGGATIIDIKEPDRGSLGRCDPAAIGEIAALVRRHRPETLLSAALGEVRESTDSPPLPAECAESLNLVKSGLSGLVPQNGGTSNWQEVWHRCRTEHSRHTRSAAQWVAVSYADAARSGSPSPEDVLAEGRRLGCPVLLIDTYVKDESTLLDWLSMADLRRLRQATHDGNMKLALAGRISISLLPQILAVDPDIVAVRGAACEQSRRTAAVTAERVRELVDLISGPVSVSASTIG